VKTFKIYSPGNQKSKIILTAHSREVDETPLQNLMTEYADEFYDTLEDGKKKNYIIRAYVLGKYLDTYVNTERNAFEFEDDKQLFYPISRNQIEVCDLEGAGKV
jgi:NurA-like 5'-3' nuclease